MIVFKGQNLQSSWFPSQAIPEWYYTTSANGWTSNDIRFEWLSRIFITETADRAAQLRNRLLILDGHGSHITLEFMWACYQHSIYLLYLPAHSSHILQPLDLAPFSVTKSSYRDQIRALAALDDAAPIKKQAFISI